MRQALAVGCLSSAWRAVGLHPGRSTSHALLHSDTAGHGACTLEELTTDNSDGSDPSLRAQSTVQGTKPKEQ